MSERQETPDAHEGADTPHFHLTLMTDEGVEDFIVPLPPALPADPAAALEAGVLCGALAVLRSRGMTVRAEKP